MPKWRLSTLPIALSKQRGFVDESSACGPDPATTSGLEAGSRKTTNNLEASDTISWLDVRVGDVLEVRNRDNIPADLLMVSCSDPNGMCFVMTSNLDGETNLKPRIVNPDVRAVTAPAAEVVAVGRKGGDGGEGMRVGGALALVARKAAVECDLPNQKLDHFDGTMVVSLNPLGWRCQELDSGMHAL